MTASPARFVRPDSTLDFDLLLTEFMAFWVEHGDILAGRVPYQEVAPQLVMMAFMQRIVNGGGYIDREYGVGRGRIDLLVRWPLAGGGEQREAVELKVRTDKTGDPLDKGLRQLDAYLDRLGLDTGLLVIFDRRKGAAPIHERTKIQSVCTPESRHVRLMLA